MEILFRARENREQSALEIFVHFFYCFVHWKVEVFVQFRPGEAERFWDRTFSIVKNDVAESIFAVVAKRLAV